jgi:hypothetical protein
MNATASVRRGHWQRYRVLYILFAISLAPIAASYYAYFVSPPQARTNYGTLVEPQRPVPDLAATQLDGSGFDLRALRGRWVFVIVDSARCDDRCAAKLLHMRQQRTMAGKEMHKIERVWFVTDKGPIAPQLISAYEGTQIARADEHALKSFLELPADAGTSLRDHIWIIDPLGNLMLRWPRDPDPKGTKADMDRLLKAAAIWTRVERENP